MFVELSEVVPGGVNDTEDEQACEDLSIFLVVINVDCIDVYDENGHVEEVEEAAHHVDLQGEFVPLEFDYVGNCGRAEDLQFVRLRAHVQQRLFSVLERSVSFFILHYILADLGDRI